MRHVDHDLVDLDHGCPLDGPVLEDLPQRGALAAADDGDAAGMGVGEHAGMDQGLVVGLVAVQGGLHHPVQEDDAVGPVQLGVVGLVRPVPGKALAVGQHVVEARVDGLVDVDALILARDRGDLLL